MTFDTPGASFEAVQLVTGAGLRRRIRALTFTAVSIVMVCVVVGGVLLRSVLHADYPVVFAVLVVVPLAVVAAVATAGIRRFNAVRLRRRGTPARLLLTPEGMSVRSATDPLDRPWSQLPVLHLQSQGAAACTLPAFDAEKRRVLFVSASAEGLRRAIEFHSGGLTRATVVRSGQLSNSLRNISEGTRRL